MIKSGDISPVDGTSRCMTPQEVRAAQPAPQPPDHRAALAAARERMMAAGQWTASQFMGRRWPIGCVALEITQRCNLDCGACYLSENAEAVKDLPLQEVFNRIDMIFAHYGPNTDVQVTGGDPTLRKRDELVAIVRRIRDKGMRPTLFTNGIRARRDLLQELAAAGLVDVAFHVDMTQQRKGNASEVALNALRQEYIERARGVGLSVMFNTTVFDGNFDQIPEIVAFFIRNSGTVRLASFQLLADTGRGILDGRDPRITISSVRRQIELGARTSLSFDTAQTGHARCNRYAMTLVTNGKVYDMLDDQDLFNDVLEHTAQLQFDRRSQCNAIVAFMRGIMTSPRLMLRGALWLLGKLWQAKADLLRARGRVDKLSFFVHDFMDACSLEKDRIDACVFTTTTGTGPISMCLHNAERDAFVLSPVGLQGAKRDSFWSPLSGEITPEPIRIYPMIDHDSKLAKGRLKRAVATPAK
ncbi:MAG: radical SAM protein [Betaproteobacteria bacterium]